MLLKHDRQIIISVGKSRKETQWIRQTITVGELWERLKTPYVSTETLSQYMQMKKAQQDNLKDVGGFVGGSLNGGRRKAGAVTGRDIVTLDFDMVPPYRHQEVINNMDRLNCAYLVHSTRKHNPAAPRLRVLVPISRTVTADEYGAISRYLAARIVMEWADQTTFDPCRLMYWPSCCADGEYIYQYADRPMLDSDKTLEAFNLIYGDWHDPYNWPGIKPVIQRGKKRPDPRTKSGYVGAFCRAYDIHRAICELIPGVYTPVDGHENRYTYVGGSTAGGAIIYDDGQQLFSHHNTDPCSGDEYNSFDLVRIHKFGKSDADAAEGTPVHKLPSYKAMCEYVETLPDVVLDLSNAAIDYAGLEITQDTAKKMDYTQAGGLKATLNNILIILEEDPRFKGRLRKNNFSGFIDVFGDLPWKREKNRWNDSDTNALRATLEQVNHITKVSKDDCWTAVDVVANRHSYHPVKDYLNTLKWDGIPRLDTLFIDYLGAEDTPYTRAVTRKQFTGAVARVMEPGIKFDTMLVLVGPQGGVKSSILNIMAGDWFTDSLTHFVGKESSEHIQGVWIVEIAELQAFDKSTTETIKGFLSRKSDRFRAAYARTTLDWPRQCVIFGTTNKYKFLRDVTGGRRFWPVETDQQPRKKDVWKDLPVERDQIWAEAMTRYSEKELLYLTGDIEKKATELQEESREIDSREPLLFEFAEKRIPHDWDKWPLDRRRDFWAGHAEGDYILVPRKTLCAIEFLCEALNYPLGRTEQRDTRAINDILYSRFTTLGWKKGIFRTSNYGVQRGIVLE